MLQNKTNKIIERYELYQWSQPIQEMKDLYTKLIQEEIQEYHQAATSWNIIWVYDAIADIYRVKTIHNYLRYKDTKALDTTKSFHLDIPHNIIADLLDEVIKSNFTKKIWSREDGEKKGKIIKWPDYVKPDIETVLRKHWIIK